MPKIPTYGTDLIDEQALPGVRQSSVASQETFADKGLATLGAGLSKAGADMLDIATKERAKIDEARVQEKYTLLSKAGNESLYGNNGATRLIGASAVGVADKWRVDFDKTAEKLIEDLTPNQKQMFGKYALTLKRGMYDNVLRHESAQMVAYQDQSYKELVSTAIDTAASSYRDGTLIGIQAGIAVDAMRKRPEYIGASADVRAGMEKELRAGVHSAVIDRAIQQNDTAYASEYFGAVKDDIPLKYRSKIEAHLKPATDFAEGRALALEVQDKIAKGDMTVSQGERYMMEKAKTKEAFSVAESMMREAQDAQKREANKVAGGMLEKFELAPTRSTMNKVMASPEYRNMEPEARAHMLKYMRSEIEQGDVRARTLANMQTPEKLIEYGEAASNPALATMTEAEIRGKYQTKLGKDLANKLVAAAKEAKTTAGKFQIDKDLLNEAIPKTLLQPQHKDQLNAFRGIVESTLQEWKLKNPGKTPTLEEQKQIARSANAEYIEIGRVWNSNVKSYEVKPDMRAVPKDFYDQSKAWARQNGKALTDEQILQAWQKQKGKK